MLRFNANDGSAMAGYIAFAMLLAMFPFVIVAVMVASLIIGLEQSRATIAALVELLPPNVADTIEPMLLDVVKVDRGSVLTLSALVAVWSSSSGVEAFRTAFDRAYEVEDPRPIWLSRLVAIAIVFLGTATFLVAGVGIVFGPLLFHLLGEVFGIVAPGSVTALRYTLGVIVFIFFLLVLHLVLPPWRRGRRLWPGVIVTALLWFAGAVAFSVYLRYAPSFTITYGTMAGVVVTMLFFYLTGAVIIYGAELNASLGRLRVWGRA
ncbi:MAG TPA: YihY/virulence factor BrkB family protein [Paracoccaceae bacterium]|nr:YihY/virulence factor BrkB family protein [Paracoccaceae bacterium]